MLIALYSAIVNVVIPQIGAYVQGLLDPVMAIIITIAGIVIIFSAVGIKISNNLGSTIVSGIFRAIGYIVRTIFRAIGWIVRNIFRIIPRVFAESRRTFKGFGLNALASNLLAVVVVVVIIAIII